MDVRISIIEKRLRTVRRIIGITAGKGGVGKSCVASLLALSLATRAKAVGLLDLDLSSPSTHYILGIKDAKIVEDKGMVPPSVSGIRFMSSVLFAGDNVLPLRGIDMSNAIIEMLSTTIWGDLDLLLIDMPPGTSDAILDLIRLVKRIEFIVVVTPSSLASHVVGRHILLLKEYGLPILCLIENLRMVGDSVDSMGSVPLEVRRLFSIPYEKGFEAALGDPELLKRTEFFRRIEDVSLFLLGDFQELDHGPRLRRGTCACPS